jgi:hypothetical protein
VVRLCAFLVAVAACNGEIDEGASVEGLSPAEQLARTAWIKQAMPALKTGTCDTCHEGERPDAPPYLMGATVLDSRDTMVTFVPSVVSLGSPKTSPVLLKGMHEGPSLAADQISDILAWISYEHDARGAGMVIETDKDPIADCSMGSPGDGMCLQTTIDLTSAGSAGSTITFYATQLGSDLYIQQLVATAGPSGLNLVHPIFTTWPAMGSNMTDGLPDANDTFYNIILDTAAGTKSTLAATTSFVGFSAADPISIKFDTLSTKM